MKKFFFIVLMLSCGAHAVFNQNNVRYLSGPELLQSLFEIGIRPNEASDYTLLATCGNFTVENQTALGINQPTTGTPASSAPSIATLSLISDCVQLYFANERLVNMNRQSWVGDEFIEILKKANLLPTGNKDYTKFPWSPIPQDGKKALAKFLVNKILGPDELIEDYGLVSSAEQLRLSLLNNMPNEGHEIVRDVIQKMVLSLVLRDEFLSY